MCRHCYTAGLCAIWIGVTACQHAIKVALRATSNLNEMLGVLRIQATAICLTTCILHNPYLQRFALSVLPPHTSPAATQILPGFLRIHVFMNQCVDTQHQGVQTNCHLVQRHLPHVQGRWTQCSGSDHLEDQVEP